MTARVPLRPAGSVVGLVVGLLAAGCGSGTAGAGVREEVACGPGRAELTAARDGDQVVVRLRLSGLEPGTQVIADITQDESPLDEGTVTADGEGRASLSGPLLDPRPTLVAASVVPTRSDGPECRLRLDTAPLR